jgi:hypothetical protein
VEQAFVNDIWWGVGVGVFVVWLAATFFFMMIGEAMSKDKTPMTTWEKVKWFLLMFAVVPTLPFIWLWTKFVGPIRWKY